MSERIQALAHLLPGKTTLEECSLEELQQLAKRHPYFAPAQFLLLEKLKATNSPDYEAQHRKAVLYFHDPLLFDQFISEERFHVDDFSISTTPRTEEQKYHLDVPLPENNNHEEVSPADTDSSKMMLQEGDSADLSSAVESEDIVTEPSSISLQTFVEQPSFETLTQGKIIHSEGSDEVLSPRGESASSADDMQHASTLTGIAGPNDGGIKAAVTDEEHDYPSVAEKPTFPADEVSETTSLDEQASVPEVGNSITDAELHPGQQEHRPDADRNGPQSTTVAAVNPGPTTATPHTGSNLLFEPFHTVDYFASQGIKITADELPKDRLGKQLRSFTEWLRVMKRLPAAEMARTPESTAEKTVESLASHSVAESDVITEAMAEVWVKQGNREKARETYNKLSLLNPSKKAYFAGKIENLKGS